MGAQPLWDKRHDDLTKTLAKDNGLAKDLTLL
jgi:hypothetical protein